MSPGNGGTPAGAAHAHRQAQTGSNAVKGLAGLPYKVFVPRDPHPGGRVLVSIHGVSRNAREHLDLLRPYAERHGAALIVPSFAADSYRDYQRMGRRGRGPRADLALIRLLNDVGSRSGLATDCVDIFGFSGGAQFAHRFAMAHSRRVRRLVLGAAGWYTMPDHKQPYPYGIADAEGLGGVRLSALAAARLPTLVLVGEHDDCPDDEELNRTQTVCRSQGLGRLHRAQAWVQAMKAYASVRGESAAVELQVLPGVGHSFRDAVIQGGLGSRIFQHCYAPGLNPGLRKQAHNPAEESGTGQVACQGHMGGLVES